MARKEEKNGDNLIILRIESLDLKGVDVNERVELPAHIRVQNGLETDVLCTSRHGRVIDEPARGLMVICESCEMFWQ